MEALLHDLKKEGDAQKPINMAELKQSCKELWVRILSH